MRKDFRPLPFSVSLGIEGLFRFELRDREGHFRSQMVTPDVFARYQVGDYFNDREKPAFRGQPAARPEPLTDPALRRKPLEEYSTPYRPTRLGRVDGIPAPEMVHRAGEQTKAVTKGPVNIVKNHRKHAPKISGARKVSSDGLSLVSLKEKEVAGVGFRHAVGAVGVPGSSVALPRYPCENSSVSHSSSIRGKKRNF